MFFVHQYRLSYGKSVGVLCFLCVLCSQWAVLFGLWLCHVVLGLSSSRIHLRHQQRRLSFFKASGMATRLSSPSIAARFLSWGCWIMGFLAPAWQINLPILAHKVREHSLTSAFEEKSLLQLEWVGLTYMSIVMFFTSYKWKQVATRHLPNQSCPNNIRKRKINAEQDLILKCHVWYAKINEYSHFASFTMKSTNQM